MPVMKVFLVAHLITGARFHVVCNCFYLCLSIHMFHYCWCEVPNPIEDFEEVPFPAVILAGNDHVLYLQDTLIMRLVQPLQCNGRPFTNQAGLLISRWLKRT